MNLRSIVIIFITSCTLFSCSLIGDIKIERYRKKPKDPELIGEWFHKAIAEELKANPKLIEECIKHNDDFIAGKIYHENGDLEVIRLYYSKNGEPYLEKDSEKGIFYTDKEKGVIYRMLTYHKPGELNNLVGNRYEIRGNEMCFATGKNWKPDYERRTVTIDLFPKLK